MVTAFTCAMTLEWLQTGYKLHQPEKNEKKPALAGFQLSAGPFTWQQRPRKLALQQQRGQRHRLQGQTLRQWAL
jgi:hypothetical protein